MPAVVEPLEAGQDRMLEALITAWATSDGATSDHELIATRQRVVPTPHSTW